MASRVLVRLITELAQERGITVHPLSHGWILLLQKNGTTRRIFGYDFDLNDAVAQMLAKDKSATALLLQFHNVPCVEHHLFLRPDIEGYAPERGNWAAMKALAEAYNYHVVCKPNTGTSGQDVYQVHSPRELEWVVQRLFQEYKAIAIAPYYDIPREYRVILLDDQVLLMYEKRRPTIVGDGRTPLGELVAQTLAQCALPERVFQEAQQLYRQEWRRVLPKGEVRPLIWRHNLAAGAQPVLEIPEDLRERLKRLARQAMQILGLRTAAVDIVETEEGLRVLEINSGIMMEYFALRHPQGEALARHVYTTLLHHMFPETSLPSTSLPHENRSNV